MSKNGGFFAKTPCAHMEKISARSGAQAGEWQFREFVLLFVSSWRRNIRHCEDNGGSNEKNEIYARILRHRSKAGQL